MDRPWRGHARSAPASDRGNLFYVYELSGRCQSHPRDGDSRRARDWSCRRDGCRYRRAKFSSKSLSELRAEFPVIVDTLAKTRPTAVDLFWALDRMNRRFMEISAQTSDLAEIKHALVEEIGRAHV